MAVEYVGQLLLSNGLLRADLILWWHFLALVVAADAWEDRNWPDEELDVDRLELPVAWSEYLSVVENTLRVDTEARDTRGKCHRILCWTRVNRHDDMSVECLVVWI